MLLPLTPKWLATQDILTCQQRRPPLCQTDWCHFHRPESSAALPSVERTGGKEQRGEMMGWDHWCEVLVNFNYEAGFTGLKTACWLCQKSKNRLLEQPRISQIIWRVSIPKLWWMEADKMHLLSPHLLSVRQTSPMFLRGMTERWGQRSSTQTCKQNKNLFVLSDILKLNFFTICLITLSLCIENRFYIGLPGLSYRVYSMHKQFVSWSYLIQGRIPASPTSRGFCQNRGKYIQTNAALRWQWFMIFCPQAVAVTSTAFQEWLFEKQNKIKKNPIELH